MLRRGLVGWVYPTFLVAAGACSDELPPLPEAVIVVDTDAPVPALVDRLRVDFYAGDGTWIESRDLPRRFARDWPASFSVFGESPDAARTVFLRLRAYGDGHVRDYRGERFMGRPEPGDPAELVEKAPPSEGEGPRLVRDDSDITPKAEPLPDLTIDRLIRVELEPGTRKVHRVLLRGACFGTMVDLEGRRTCIDTENERVTPRTERDGADPFAPSRVNELAAARQCTVEPRPESFDQTGLSFHDEEVCVPGGAFILGSTHVAGILNFADPSVPERVALMSPLLVDRFEVTVARWRRAREEGFLHPYDPTPNNAPLPTGGPPSYPELCTYSDAPIAGASRESHPVNCLGWDDARAFCQFYGGDLLTEAQWEYTASSTGGSGETLYPWGNDEPDCESHIYGRPVAGVPSGFCSSAGFGPAEVGAGAGDKTPLDVRDLGGSLGEWVLDSARPYDARCWASLGLWDPYCWEEAVDHRSLRGGSWSSGSGEMLAAARAAPGIVTRLYPHVGFRCARPGGGDAG